jgi:hypothetical protein
MFFIGANNAHAQYPDIPADVQKSADSVNEELL